ncbi:hypothetical protein GCM10023321_80750 [Pseudonocardia eucalypti]|uniref:Secreted protein n=1 Tax=Pseudonocardia eucalypti TaxID=648755 RepID=A0ABP9RCN2_9PSEU
MTHERERELMGGSERQPGRGICVILSTTFALLALSVVGAPSALADNGCPQQNGYRFCRTYLGNDFITVTAYPTVVKAGRPVGTTENVWIDSDRANHLAHGNGLAQYTPGPRGARYRGCSWFPKQLGGQQVVCTAWVQGY